AYGSLVGIAHAFKRGKDGDLVHEDAGRQAHSLFGRDDADGFDVHDRHVQVGAQLDAGDVHGMAEAAHGAVGDIQHDAADGVRTVVGQGANVAGHVAAALLDLDVYFELAGLGQVGDDMVGVDDLDVVRKLDVGSRHHALAFLAQDQRDVFAVVQLEHHAFQVQENVDDVF